MVENLISALVGALISLIVAVIFQERLKPVGLAFWHRFDLLYYRLFRSPSQPNPPKTFGLGKRSFPFLIVDGDGELTYQPHTVRTHVEDRLVDLPPEVEQAKAVIAKREEHKSAEGRQALWNGPVYALERYARHRTNPEENLALSLTFRPSDYFTFQATVMSLDTPLSSNSSSDVLREQYIQSRDDLSEVIPFLAQGFGTAIIVFSEDSQELILSRRSSESGARPNELDVTFVEGVHPVHDRAATHRGPDLYRTAIRGASEEVGFELFEGDVTLLGFGVDEEFYQWNILGMARLRTSVQEALERRRRGIPGKWEAQDFEVLSSQPIKVFRRLESERLWATAWVTLYWALVQVHGRTAVERAARKVFGA